MASAVLVALATGAAALVVVPIVSLVQQVEWGGYADAVRSDQARDAFRISAIASTGAVALSALLGLPLAWLLARRTFPGRDLLRAVALLPMVLPPVVGGIALLYAFNRTGLAGRPLHLLFGIDVPSSTLATVVAATFVSMPLLVVSAESAFRALDGRMDEAAAVLGASRSYRFRRLTLPTVAPALLAGAALCWARALGEYGATSLFAGEEPGVTATVPIAIYTQYQTAGFQVAVVFSVLLLLVSLLVLLLLRGQWRSPAR